MKEKMMLNLRKSYAKQWKMRPQMMIVMFFLMAFIMGMLAMRLIH